MAAQEPKELWLVPGMGHAEAACSQELVDRIGRWVDQAAAPAQAIAGHIAESNGAVAPPGGAGGETQEAARTPNAAA
jgi:hypothetical protein